MKKQKTKLTMMLGALGALGVLLMGYHRVWAQVPSLDLSVAPSVVYWHIRPGEKVTHHITLTNSGKYTLELSPSLVDFKTDDFTGNPVLMSDSGFGYIAITNPNIHWDTPFSIRPGQEIRIDLVIDVPFEADEMEHHMTVLFTGQQTMDSAPSGSSATINATMGSNLIIFISEQQTNQGKLIIDEIKIPRLIDSFSPIKFSILGKNTGKNAVAITGRAVISSRTRPTLNEYTFYPDMILAYSSRLVRGMPTEELDQNQEQIERQDPSILKNLSTEFKHSSPFLFGLYTINITLGSETATTSFFAVPFAALIALVALPMVIIFIKSIKKN